MAKVLKVLGIFRIFIVLISLLNNLEQMFYGRYAAQVCGSHRSPSVILLIFSVKKKIKSTENYTKKTVIPAECWKSAIKYSQFTNELQSNQSYETKKSLCQGMIIILNDSIETVNTILITLGSLLSGNNPCNDARFYHSAPLINKSSDPRNSCCSLQPQALARF